MATKKIRNRLPFRMYELCRINVPAEVGEYIMGKAEMLKNCEAHKVYDELKAEHRLSPNYETSRRLQYLYELFWVLGSRTPIFVEKMGETEAVPTNYLEREDSSFGFGKVQPCVVLSLRVRWPGLEGKRLYLNMQAIVEGKMRSFKTDFYFHDMMTFSREMWHHPLLWEVGQSHTMNEVLDAEGESECWVATMATDGDRVRAFLNGKDDTWMGAAMTTLCGKDDWYYYHDGAVLHKVSRDRFKAIHDRHVERVRELTREKIELKKAA